MDLRALHYFVAVAENENIGKASNALGISQSPLSRQIAGLERSLGFTLFDRIGRRIALTREGRAFLAEARLLLKHAEDVRSFGQRQALEGPSTLKVGYVDGFLYNGALAAFLHRAHQLQPDLQIELMSLHSHEQIQALKSGRIDLAMTYGVQPAGPDLTILDLPSEELLLALPPAHRLSGRGRIAPRDLAKERWITQARTANVAARDQFRTACRIAGFEPIVAVEASNPLSALMFVEQGIGITLVQDNLSKAYRADVVFKEIPWLTLAVAFHIVFKTGHREALLRQLCTD